ncbi:MAG: hypothetical protein AAFR73_12090 [Pseudomonadota bacterium]
MRSLTSILALMGSLSLSACFISDAPLPGEVVPAATMAERLEIELGDQVQVTLLPDPDRMTLSVFDPEDQGGVRVYEDVRFLDGLNGYVIETTIQIPTFFGYTKGYTYGFMATDANAVLVYFFDPERVLDRTQATAEMDRTMRRHGAIVTDIHGLYEVTDPLQVEAGTLFAVHRLGMEPWHILSRNSQSELVQ